MLMVGNAFTKNGSFYKSHHQDRDIWNAFRISAYDTPNFKGDGVVVGGMVTPEDVEDKARQWGKESALYKGSVLAEFSDSLDDVVITLDQVLAAAKVDYQAGSPLSEEIILACDVARYGKDKTVLFKRQGNNSELIFRVQGKNTMEVAGMIGRYCDDHKVDIISVDDTGVGGGVTDRLGEIVPTIQIVPFKGGSSASDKDRFANATTEAWWKMRDWIINGGKIPDDQALISQLSSRSYKVQSDKKLQLESKDNMSNSPDAADALSMTFVDRPGWGIW